MTQRFEARDWRTFLPAVFGQMDQLDIRIEASPKPDSLWVVPVPMDRKPMWDKTPLPQGLKSTLSKALEDWQGGAPVSWFTDQTLLLVPVSKVKVEAQRLARDVGHKAFAVLKDLKPKKLSFLGLESIGAKDMMIGFIEASYRGGTFRGEGDKTELPSQIDLVDAQGLQPQEIKDAKSFLRSVLLSRTLQDAPASWLTPPKWAQIAQDYFKTSSAQVTVLGKKDLEKQAMGSFLSVAAGSPLDPQLIRIDIKGKSSAKKICLVGKGLTFDAGGISLKPSQGMGEMKYDMSGGAAVMGTAAYLAEVQPEYDVTCLIGAVENMPSGTATRPGDIVQACNGKTIEVLNTDAEGRLVLADILAYASSQKPDLILDIATLTGAVLHGLGHVGAAVMSDHPQLVQALKQTSEKYGEPIWQLPLWPELQGEVKSEVADLKNIAKPNVLAGTIIGGIFLKEFVEGDIPWAHIDIAGTAWSCMATGYPKAGGSGFGVRLLSGICLTKEL